MIVSYSKMKKWVSSAAVRSSAEAVAEDGATFAEVAGGAEPTWRDLRLYFETSSGIAEDIYLGGKSVTDYGNSVAKAGTTTVQHLNEFADRLEKLEASRTLLIKRAKESNQWFADNPRQEEVGKPGDPPPAVCGINGDWNWQRGESEKLQEEIDKACKEYEEICSDLAGDLKKMGDEGSDPNFFLSGMKTVLEVGVFVAGFIPPVATGAAVVGGGMAIHDAYSSRSRELREEHPELSTSEIRGSATTSAIVTGGVQVAFDYGTGKTGEFILIDKAYVPPKIAKPAANGVSEAVSVPIGPVLEDLGDRAGEPSASPSTGDTDGWPFDITPYLNPVPSGTQLQEESAAQERVRETKDYDGDGYTDPEFRPGSEEIKHGGVTAATVVVTPEDDED